MATPLRVGVISDIQYADKEDGADFSGLEKRYFRNSLQIVEAAVGQLNEAQADVVVTLGDAIDGWNASKGVQESALQSVTAALSVLQAPLGRFDLIGNHDLYNFNREALATCGLRCTAREGSFYHSVVLSERWEIVILDAYDLSMIGYPQEHPNLVKSLELMRQNNPAVLSEVPGTDWFEGLPVEKHRWVPFNGGLSETQIVWLRQTLETAHAAGRKVLVFTHVPLYAPATKPKTVMWNAEDVMEVLHEFAEVVSTVVAGHDHAGGYAVDPAGIHHVTMNSPLTAEPVNAITKAKNVPFGIIECHEDFAVLRCPSGRAVVMSGTEGTGAHYPELLLAKGSVNVPV